MRHLSAPSMRRSTRWWNPGRALIAWVLLTAVIMAPLPLTAQPPGMRPPMPGGPPVGGKKPSPKPAAKKPAAAPKVQVPTEPVNEFGLPLNYKPPGEVPDLMTLDQPLLDVQLKEFWKKNKTKYSTTLRNGTMTEADKALIADGIKYRLYVMAEKDELRNLYDLRLDISGTDLGQAAKIPTKADDVKKFREFVIQQILKNIDPLLKNNFYVRYQAVTLLGELDLLPADANRQFKLETYTPACLVLIKVLDDPEQPTAIKIAAARSLIRLIRFGDLPVESRHKVAASVVAELAKTDTHSWYQMRLADVLSTLDVTLDLVNRKPYVVNALQDVLRDPQRDIRARAKAAKALGRVPLDPQVDISALVRDVMQFALELATAAQQNPEKPEWKQAFWDLYMAYMPLDANDKDATKKNPAGFLNNRQTANLAQQTYKLVLPTVNTVLAGKPVNVPDVQSLQGWLQANKPVAEVKPGGARQPPAPQPQPANAN